MTDTIISDSRARAIHRFAVLAAAATFCLIFVGGLVTSTGSALAVPDWPLAFGKLIPAWKGGIRFEFGHRVVAGTVSILTLVLAVWAWRVEPRRWVRKTAIAAFILVLVQATLGGITVLLELPLAIAVAHALTGQAFFCVMVAIAVFTNPDWERVQHRAEPDVRPPLAILAGITTGVIYLQILIGAIMRHLGAGLAIPDFPLSFGAAIPPYWNEFIAVNFAHRVGAVIVTIMIVWTVSRVMRSYADEPALRRPAIGLLILLLAQVSLGAFTIWSARAVLPTTTHVAVGAAVLATSLVLTIRAYHIYGIPNHRGAAEAASRNGHMVERRVSA